MAELPEAEKRRRKVLGVTGEELVALYANWADQYDEDIVEELGYAGPKHAAEVFARQVPKQSRVLDIGAGTGLIGVALHAEGYRNLEALDVSPEMLAHARRKAVYKAYHEMGLGDPSDIEAHAYDAVISIGTMTLGHIGPNALKEMIRITRPGGYVVFSLVPRIGREAGYHVEMNRLTQTKAWSESYVSEAFALMASRPQDGDYNIWMFQVL